MSNSRCASNLTSPLTFWVPALREDTTRSPLGSGSVQQTVYRDLTKSFSNLKMRPTFRLGWNNRMGRQKIHELWLDMASEHRYFRDGRRDDPDDPDPYHPRVSAQAISTNYPSLLNDYAMREGLLESTVTAEDVSTQCFRNPL